MKILSLIVLFFLSLQTFGDTGLTIVAVGDPKVQTESMLVLGPKASGNLSKEHQAVLSDISEILRNDFSFYKKKLKVSKSNKNLEQSDTSFKRQGVEYLIRISGKTVSGRLQYHIKANQLSTGRSLLDDRGNLNKTPSSLRGFAHDISDNIFRSIYKKESIFKSQIAFVSNKDGSRAKPVKELYIMDFDGHNKKRLTYHYATVISPAISHDKRKILYSLINEEKGKRNINLYLLDRNSKTTKLISSRKGINSGAVFMPGDKDILLTLSHSGNAEIYTMNLASGNLKRVTKHFSADVDPSISVDGKLLTFLSARPGKPMIYTKDITSSGIKAKRISFVGKYNATPRFSPDGKEIVFSSWLDNRFDLFRINSDATGLSRLTRDFGSNEDPTYSNDGEFIAFSSLRVLSRKKADQKIYIMSKDSEIFGSITDDFGNCITPRWSK